MIYSAEVQNMCSVAKGAYHGPAPIPEEASGSGQGDQGHQRLYPWYRLVCSPAGACKLTLNIKEGVIEEALVETIGCSGMTHSAAMAAEILIGKTILDSEHRSGVRRHQHRHASAVRADRIWPVSVCLL